MHNWHQQHTRHKQSTERVYLQSPQIKKKAAPYPLLLPPSPSPSPLLVARAVAVSTGGAGGGDVSITRRGRTACSLHGAAGACHAMAWVVAQVMPHDEQEQAHRVSEPGPVRHARQPYRRALL